MTTISQPEPSSRLASIDAYRGLVMFLLWAEVLQFCAVAAALPDSGFWKFLCHHQSHVEWVGCSLHDLIMPSFCFLVGVSLPFSIASRRARGHTFGAMARHAATRVLIFILLGTVIASFFPRRLTWPFDWVLPQIALGYGFLFLLSVRQVRDSWIALGAILVGYWLAFVLYPLPGPDFDYAKVGVSEQWLKEHGLTGFAAHWQKNSNFAWAFDTWFFNLFPRADQFAYNRAGLATLNFIPTLATMILGLIAGDVLRSDRPPRSKVRWLAMAGVAGLVNGWLLGTLGVCPVVKSIWTPSWVLFSGGWCFLMLTASYTLVDLLGRKCFATPFVVIGINSITAYCLPQFFQGFAFHRLRRIFGEGVFRLFGDAYEPLVYGSLLLLGFWIVLLGMYRKKLFLRI
jgi:heparan-alpha-glucosaminide N-acetyltransferase